MDYGIRRHPKSEMPMHTISITANGLDEWSPKTANPAKPKTQNPKP